MSVSGSGEAQGASDEKHAWYGILCALARVPDEGLHSEPSGVVVQEGKVER